MVEILHLPGRQQSVAVEATAGMAERVPVGGPVVVQVVDGHRGPQVQEQSDRAMQAEIILLRLEEQEEEVQDQLGKAKLLLLLEAQEVQG
jgi:hypothetical protein